jgi:hypothetical protein
MAQHAATNFINTPPCSLPEWRPLLLLLLLLLLDMLLLLLLQTPALLAHRFRHASIITYIDNCRPQMAAIIT